MQKSSGGWQGANGSTAGASVALGAIDVMKATYFGYHGYAGNWLAENPVIAKTIANKLGYWYFVNTMTTPSTWTRGCPAPLSIGLENRGVARAYHRFPVELKFESGGAVYTHQLSSWDNQSWLPGKKTETTSVTLPLSLPAGTYSVKLRVLSDSVPGKPVGLGIKNENRNAAGYYNLGSITAE